MIKSWWRVGRLTSLLPCTYVHASLVVDHSAVPTVGRPVIPRRRRCRRRLRAICRNYRVNMAFDRPVRISFCSTHAALSSDVSSCQGCRHEPDNVVRVSQGPLYGLLLCGQQLPVTQYVPSRTSKRILLDSTPNILQRHLQHCI